MKKANKAWRTNRHKLFNFNSFSFQSRRWAHIKRYARRMKKIPYKNILMALICLIVSIWFWTSTLEYLLQFIGVHSGRTIGWILVITVNLLHYLKGWFHPDSVASNSEHNIFYGDYLYIKAVAFLTIGTSIYAIKAVDEYKEDA